MLYEIKQKELERLNAEDIQFIQNIQAGKHGHRVSNLLSAFLFNLKPIANIMNCEHEYIESDGTAKFTYCKKCNNVML